MPRVNPNQQPPARPNPNNQNTNFSEQALLRKAAVFNTVACKIITCSFVSLGAMQIATQTENPVIAAITSAVGVIALGYSIYSVVQGTYQMNQT